MKIGPSWKTKRSSFWLKTLPPVTSLGIRVGGELDALERGPEDVGERAHEERLAQAGHALDEHVPAREDGDQRVEDELVLPEEHLGGLAAEAIEALSKVGGVHRARGLAW